MQSTWELKRDCITKKTKKNKLPPPCCHFSFLSFYRCNGEQQMYLFRCLSIMLSPTSCLSFSLPHYWFSNPIQLLWLWESLPEYMAAHLIWAQINICVSYEKKRKPCMHLYNNYLIFFSFYTYIKRCKSSSKKISGHFRKQPVFKNNCHFNWLHPHCKERAELYSHCF